MAEMRGIRIDEKSGGGYTWASSDGFSVRGHIAAGATDVETVNNLGTSLALVYPTGTKIISAQSGSHSSLIPNPTSADGHLTIAQLQAYAG